MKDRILGLPRNVFFLGLTSFFNDFSSEMVASVFPAFFISVLKTGAESLGLVEGVAEAASNFIKVYSGRWSDRIEKRKVFAIVGYTLSVFTRPFYVFAGSVGAVIGLRLTDRIGKGLRDPPRDALISLSTPKKEMGRSFGYHRAMDTLGAIVGPLVASREFRSSERRGQPARVSRGAGAARHVPELPLNLCPRAGLLPLQPGTGG
jgi:MFS family permease